MEIERRWLARGWPDREADEVWHMEQGYVTTAPPSGCAVNAGRVE